MRNLQFKGLFKDAFIYLLASILNSSVPFILLPILTRVLSTEEYGEVTMFSALISFLGAIVGINAHSFSSRKYFENVSEKEKKSVNTAAFIFLGISLLVVLILTFFFRDLLKELFGLSYHQLYMGVIASGFIFIINFRLVQWQVRKKALKFGFLQVGQALLNLGLSVLLVLVLTQGPDGRIDAYFYSAAAIGILALVLILRDKLIDFQLPEKRIFKEAWQFGSPLIIHLGGTFLLAAADRVVIKENMSLSDVGVYMVAVQISLVLNVGFSAFNKAYVPWLFEKLTGASMDTKLRIVRLTLLYYLGLVSIIILGFLIGPHVVRLISGPDFIDAASLVGLIILGQCFVGAYLMVTNFLFFTKKTGMLATVTIIAGLINLVLLYFMTIEFGLKGAAYSFVVAMFVRFIFTVFLVQKAYPMPWKRGFLSLVLIRGV